jgi:O-antigen ligase
MKINKSSIFLIFCFLAFIRPDSLNLLPGVTNFYYIYRVVVVLSIFFVFLLRKTEIDKFAFIWITFEAVVIFSTTVEHGNLSYAIFQGLTITSLAFLFSIYSKRLVILLKSIYRVLSLFTIINFITIVIFPKGMYVTGVTNTASENWFLGFKNEQTAYFLPLIGLVFILSKIEGFNKSKIAILFISILSSILIHSSTLLVGLGILLIVEFFPFIRKNSKVFNQATYFIISVVMFVAIPILRLQNLFDFLIEGILHKSLTLTYRTDLWDRAIAAIFQHPIIGWGEQPNIVKYELYDSMSIISAHNQFLEYTFTGGILLILIYVAMNIMLIKRTWSIKSYEIVQIVSGLYLALQITLIAEVFTEITIFMIYFLVWYSYELCQYPVYKKKGSFYNMRIKG